MNRSVLPLAACAALTLAATAAAQKPLKVYVLCGQSNMEGHAKIATFDYLADDPASQPLLAKMRDEHGAPRVRDDVWIAYRTGDDGAEVSGPLTAGFGSRRNPAKSDDKIGPEFTFGIRMGELHDEPVLLIKCAWGGKSLNTDFRPPSAGPYEFSDEQLKRFAERHEKDPAKNKDVEQIRRDKVEATGRYYRDTVAYVQQVLADPGRYCPEYDEKAGFELCGFVWFQGWNDMVDRDTYPHRDQPGGYAQYASCLDHFIRDMRKDLKAPQLPFVIGVMGVGGPLSDDKKDDVHRNFRAAMAAPASSKEFAGTVAAVETSPFWDEPLEAISEKMGQVGNFERALRNKQKGSANADGSLDEAAQKALVAKYRAEHISEAEESAWQRGASNGGYHYLGCAKTMAGIGVAFAEAMHQLEQR
ncbi:MAG: sialate O-acetylesterase [Planctomycetota bacterium]